MIPCLNGFHHLRVPSHMHCSSTRARVARSFASCCSWRTANRHWCGHDAMGCNGGRSAWSSTLDYLSIYLSIDLIWYDLIWSSLILSYLILSIYCTCLYLCIYICTHTPFGPTLPHILYKCQPVGFSQTHLFQLDRSRSLCCEFKSTLPVTTFEGQPVNPHRNTRKQKKLVCGWNYLTSTIPKLSMFMV